jgi:hypothetical protein
MKDIIKFKKDAEEIINKSSKKDLSEYYNNIQKDIKYTGIPNICFSLTDKDDKREVEFAKQRVERGFDDSETWSLDFTIASFILPRLKRYQELVKDVFVRDYEVEEDINSFMKALELVIRDGVITSEEKEVVKKGLEKFPKIFMGLWW